MATNRIRIYNPTSQPKHEMVSSPGAEHVQDLTGKSLVILDNGWPIWEKVVPRLAELLADQYALSKTTIYKVPKGHPPQPDLLAKAAKEGDVAIVGLGN
ncbi:hypothetical protein ACFLZG_07045 [Thermodesulfobacteriota bacterium]